MRNNSDDTPYSTDEQLAMWQDAQELFASLPSEEPDPLENFDPALDPQWHLYNEAQADDYDLECNNDLPVYEILRKEEEERERKAKERYNPDQTELEFDVETNVLQLTSDPLPFDLIPTEEEKKIIQLELTEILEQEEFARTGQSKLKLKYQSGESLTCNQLKRYAELEYGDRNALDHASVKRARLRKAQEIKSYTQRMERARIKREKASTNDRRQADKLESWERIRCYCKVTLTKKPFAHAGQLINYACRSTGYNPRSSKTKAELRAYLVKQLEITVFGAKNRQFWTIRENFTTPPTKHYSTENHRDFKSSEAGVLSSVRQADMKPTKNTSKARTTKSNKLNGIAHALHRKWRIEASNERFDRETDYLSINAISQALHAGYKQQTIKRAYFTACQQQSELASLHHSTSWTQSGVVADMRAILSRYTPDPLAHRGAGLNEEFLRKTKTFEPHEIDMSGYAPPSLDDWQAIIRERFPNLPESKILEFAKRSYACDDRVFTEMDLLEQSLNPS